MRVTTWEFYNQRGEKLVGRLDQPTEEAPRAWGIFAHCFTCSKNLSSVVHISKVLTEAGFGLFRFDFTGLGESEGDFAATGFASQVSDILAAVRSMEEGGRTPRFLVGHSLGGAAVIHAARSLSTCRAVAVIGAPFSPTHVIRVLAPVAETVRRQGVGEIRIGGRVVRIGRGFFQQMDESQVLEAVENLRCSLLVLHSPDDEVVPVRHGERLYAAAPHPKAFVALDGADHLLSDKEDAQYAGRILALWLNRHILK